MFMSRGFDVGIRPVWFQSVVGKLVTKTLRSRIPIRTQSLKWVCLNPATIVRRETCERDESLRLGCD